MEKGTGFEKFARRSPGRVSINGPESGTKRVERERIDRSGKDDDAATVRKGSEPEAAPADRKAAGQSEGKKLRGRPKGGRLPVGDSPKIMHLHLQPQLCLRLEEERVRRGATSATSIVMDAIYEYFERRDRERNQ